MWLEVPWQQTARPLLGWIAGNERSDSGRESGDGISQARISSIWIGTEDSLLTVEVSDAEQSDKGKREVMIVGGG
jgi:hypothetical protein